MSSTFLVVPQWQGSGSSRAMRLVDGAEAVLHELPSAATRLIDVPLEAGDSEGTGILRFSSIRLVRERLQRELAELDEVAIIIGGDCGVEYAGVEHAARTGRVVVLWADAHADLNTADSSPSGAFHGMVLRSLIDDGVVDPENVLLLGVRDLDDAEAHFMETAGIAQVATSEVGAAVADRVTALRDSGAEPVLYVHVDLDVLDPGVFAGVGFPTPFGLTLDELTTAIAAAREQLSLRGAGVTEFAPASLSDESAPGGDDLTTILRILGALRR